MFYLTKIFLIKKYMNSNFFNYIWFDVILYFFFILGKGNIQLHKIIEETKIIQTSSPLKEILKIFDMFLWKIIKKSRWLRLKNDIWGNIFSKLIIVCYRRQWEETYTTECMMILPKAAFWGHPELWSPVDAVA